MDYGHELQFGTFLTPVNAEPETVVGLAQLSEQLGLDLVTFQDHPYQPSFLDTWTLLAYVAASTVQIRLAPNVLNLPLRPPAVVARAAASLDLLSGGRIELGLGAGAFGDAVAAMGGPRRAPGAAVDALEEAILIIRDLWDTTTRGGVRRSGEHYVVDGAKRGPAPAHPIGIWLGAYKPRMLRLTGRLADGWLPSAGYLGPERLAEANAIIDEAAIKAGRSPGDIRRLYNISGSFGRSDQGFLQGPPNGWVEQLTHLAIDHGMATFILGSDDPQLITTFAQEVVPGVRDAVDQGRSAPVDDHDQIVVEPARVEVSGERSRFTVIPTLDDGTRISPVSLWDERDRPTGPPRDPERRYSRAELSGAQHLIDIHDHLRSELTQVRELIGQVLDGSVRPGSARSAINEMTMRQNNWTVGAYCAAYCRILTTHHSAEDQMIFPRLRRRDPRLTPVVDRLAAEHVVIHGVLEGLDKSLVEFVAGPASGVAVQRAMDELSDTLLSHLSYEERELVEPLARLDVLV